MTKIEIKQKFPKISKSIDDIFDIRSLVVVDENYEGIDSDEVEDFDSDEYNYMIYLTQKSLNALGKDKIKKVISQLEQNQKFENFLASEDDLYGIKTELKEKDIYDIVIQTIEECL